MYELTLTAVKIDVVLLSILFVVFCRYILILYVHFFSLFFLFLLFLFCVQPSIAIETAIAQIPASHDLERFVVHYTQCCAHGQHW